MLEIRSVNSAPAKHFENRPVLLDTRRTLTATETPSAAIPEPNFGMWFARVARDFANQEAVRRRTPRDPGAVTYAQLYESVRHVAAGFASIGVHPGDRVALIFDNRREWIVCDLALTGQGAVDVPRGADTANIEILMILAHSGSRGVVVDSPARAVEIAKNRADAPHLEFIVILDGDAEPVAAADQSVPRLKIYTFADLESRGKLRVERGIDDLALRAPRVMPDDLLTIVYTSGTTGAPKGVQLTHGNVLSNVYHVREPIPVSRGDVALSILPTWHMFERLVEYAVFDRGGILVYTDARRLKSDILSEKPALMGTVPRIWETLRDTMRDAVAKLPPFKQKLFHAATSVAVAHVRARAARRGFVAILLALPASLARSMVFTPRLQQSGFSSLKLCVSGGGSLPLALDEFFLAIGIPLVNGYGLTETSPVICVRRLNDNRPSTVGPPIKATEIKIVDGDGREVPRGSVGVLRVRGPQVTKGYYRDEEITKKAFPEPGWFDTGDLAMITREGEIQIVGRAKDTIALRGGEKIEPERVETALKASPLIVQSIVVGQDAKVLGAIIVPHLERLAAMPGVGPLDGPGEFIDQDVVKKALRAEVDALVSAAAGFRPYERPVRLLVMRRPIEPGGGLMTQTLKLKRKAICERYAAEITKMLSEG